MIHREHKKYIARGLNQRGGAGQDLRWEFGRFVVGGSGSVGLGNNFLRFVEMEPQSSLTRERCSPVRIGPTRIGLDRSWPLTWVLVGSGR
jgi:hypothetical protein